MDRWQRIESVFAAALQRPAHQRDAYVRDACRDDADLLDEVTSLLAHHHERERTEPWAAAAAQVMAAPPSLEPGTELGPYRIVSFLAAGGMGVVYRAHDPRTGRDVAIKVATQRFSDRFAREVRTVAALNHPSICTLYDVGPDYLVMELVEGPTLADRIRAGALPLDEALSIAQQIAHALDEAHEKGIVHRDLKPANIKLRPDGTVKVLDFGLAKAPGAGYAPRSGAAAPEPAEYVDRSRVGRNVAPSLPDLTRSPTHAIAGTEAGMVLGTAAYMAPEQVRGKVVDKRADIWAFGVVLYEMFTGKPLFGASAAASRVDATDESQTVSDTIAAVLTKEVNWEGVPVEARLLLCRCLEREPKKRLRDIGDALLLIDAARPVTGSRDDGSDEALLQPGRIRRLHIAWSVATLLVAAAAVALVFASRPAVEGRAYRASIPVSLNFLPNPPSSRLAVSPDGSRIAFAASADAERRVMLWIRPSDGTAAQPVAGTDGATAPFWSPDGRRVAFFADGKLKIASVFGEPVVTVCDAPLWNTEALTGAWSHDDVILFTAADTAVLARVPAAGGIPVAVTALDTTAGETRHTFPFFLPDGRRFGYLAVSGDTPVGLYVGSFESAERILVPGVHSNAQHAQGHLLYLRGGALMAQRFDAERLEWSGTPVPIAEQVLANAATVRAGAFSVSSNGVVVYQTGSALSASLVWLDRAGRQIGAFGERGVYRGLAISPDGSRAATGYTPAGGGEPDIVIFDLERAVATRFTFDPAAESAPVWSPAGDRLVYASGRKGQFDLYQKTIRDGVEEVLFEDDQDKTPWSWAGSFLLYSSRRGSQLWAMPVPESHPASRPATASGGPEPASRSITGEPSARQEPFLFVEAPSGAVVGEAAFSPDGRLVAYVSTAEFGRAEVYVKPFAASGEARRISTAGGGLPRWHPSGTEVIFLSDGSLMSATVTLAGDRVVVGAPSAWCSARPCLDNGLGYDVSADDRILTIVIQENPVGDVSTALLVNWPALLR